MTQEEAKQELQKCKESNYYFATKYCMIDGKPFTTNLSEEEFNRRTDLLLGAEDVCTIRGRYSNTVLVKKGGRVYEL